MADKNYKVFIVEGEVREPQIIDNLSKVFFVHENYKIITLPAEENIYMLWQKLKEDDFETDIIEVLREHNDEMANLLNGLSRDDFAEIYLFFDYDVHQNNSGKANDNDIVRQMLESFDNETENGKLYISYPMVEALRDYKPGVCGEPSNCFVKIENMTEYKTVSAEHSSNPHFRDYDFEDWKEIINVFAMRVSCLFGWSEVLPYENYSENVSPYTVFIHEENDLVKCGVFILSAFPEFLVDYFGNKLWTKCAKYTKIQSDKFKCAVSKQNAAGKRDS